MAGLLNVCLEGTVGIEVTRGNPHLHGMLKGAFTTCSDCAFGQ